MGYGGVPSAAHIRGGREEVLKLVLRISQRSLCMVKAVNYEKFSIKHTEKYGYSRRVLSSFEFDHAEGHFDIRNFLQDGVSTNMAPTPLQAGPDGSVYANPEAHASA